MPNNNRVVELINAEIERRKMVGINYPDHWYTAPYKFAEPGERRYLGASQIGGSCRRQRYMAIHWMNESEEHDARTLRLFDRGHREEARMVGYLRMIGVEVEEFDPETFPTLWYHGESDCYLVTVGERDKDSNYLAMCDDVTNTYHEWIARDRGIVIPEPRQFGFKAFNGHHAGHCDGKAYGIPDSGLWGLTNTDPALLEFKTHNDASFNQIVTLGVRKAKPGYYVQVNRYMAEMNLTLCVYMAVNKNNDDLYCEYIPFDSELDEKSKLNAYEAIFETKIPPRVSNSPSWYECRWCDARPQCHYGAPHRKNCRSCNKSIPVQDGRWGCILAQQVIPLEIEPKGCELWAQRSD